MRYENYHRHIYEENQRQYEGFAYIRKDIESSFATDAPITWVQQDFYLNDGPNWDVVGMIDGDVSSTYCSAWVYLEDGATELTFMYAYVSKAKGVKTFTSTRALASYLESIYTGMRFVRVV